MRKKIVLLGSILIFGLAYSQVGINTENPKTTLDVSAQRDAAGIITNNNQTIGLQAPRLSRAELTSNTATYGVDQKGALIYITDISGGDTSGQRINITSIGYYFFDGALWNKIGGSIGTAGVDNTNDEWINTTGSVILGKKSDGITARDTETDFVIQDSGNTGIGTVSPNGSALLDVQATNKGFLPPRVVLSSSTFQLNPSTANATGLWVYNTGGAGNLPAGYYYWDGLLWKIVQATTSIAPVITSLQCNTAYLNPTSYTAGVPFNGNLRVVYTEGNGGRYDSGAPFTINGLTFQLRPGNLEYGDGELVFSVTGTPINSNAMVIPMSNSLIPFLSVSQNCTVTLGNNSRADIASVAVMGYPTLYTDAANGKQSHCIILGSPDGKYAIRVIMDTTNPATTARPNVQLINLTGSSVDLYWNYNTEYGGILIDAGVMTTPPSVWGGAISGGSAWVSQSTGALGNAYWGNEGILDANSNGPEHRRYSWIDSNLSSKTAYTATIMAGAPTSGAARPDRTKVFIKLEQVKAQ
ncbi:hypothetical protein [Chryseobacterium limigenitum]|uniref:Uncharacterized protein n=1 Tax=Chryseobacterium limigenitum TaxID=1612149 RepID=A0A1K2IJH3_9FLAO|nr:hypothetical protein [Chryseobacterium limigenitum]SFZ92426.1 hypothetical protein SAMN05216324_103262 [Chryseobacterium limigenitum]